MGQENREYKDSLFVDLFYQDEMAKKNLLSLYNALHDTEYQDEDMIRKVKVDDVLYKNFKNDISFEANGQVIVFGEHQSTVNPNMPVRLLMYVGRGYEQILDKRARYRMTLVKIPTPEFYVFYNGKKEQPLEQELFLSDAFLAPARENSVELRVKVININSDMAHDVLKKCDVLREYSQFIDTVRKYSEEEDSIKKAIDECIKKGILKDYLMRKGSEVANMLVAEYSYEEDIEVKQEEAWQRGRREGELKGRREGELKGRREGELKGRREGELKGKQEGLFLSGKIFRMVKEDPNLANERIAAVLGCETDEVANVRKMFGM